MKFKHSRVLDCDKQPALYQRDTLDRSGPCLLSTYHRLRHADGTLTSGVLLLGTLWGKCCLEAMKEEEG